MGQFLYAVQKGPLPAELDRVIRRPVTTRSHENGPGGGPCQIVSSGDAKRTHYEPDLQTWSDCGGYWTGFWKEDPPAVLDLKRKTQLAGHEVKLGDGENWLIPVARSLPGGSPLPAAMILGKDGEVVTEELPQFAEFAAAAERLWQDFRIMWGWDEGEPSLNTADWIRIAAMAVGWNYHAGVNEFNSLRLITSENLVRILKAIVDYPAMEAMMDKKKVQRSETGSGDGGQD